MARWIPWLATAGPPLEAPDSEQARAIATKLYGTRLVRVQSVASAECDRDEQSTARRHRRLGWREEDEEC